VRAADRRREGGNGSMKKLWVILLLGSCAALLKAQTTEARVDGITVSNPGIYALSVMKDIPDPNTAEGTRHTVGDISLVSATTTIPARIGVHFGFYYTVTGAPNGATVQVRYVNRFPGPGLKNPATGETTHEEDYNQDVSIGDSNYKGWTFDHDYELVPGTWTFEIWYGDRKIGEQSFDVVAAQ
jgi:hypothetical protein